MKTRNSGFTIIEVMIVIAILGLLAVLVMPHPSSVKKQLAAEKVAAENAAAGEFTRTNLSVEYVGTETGIVSGIAVLPSTPSGEQFQVIQYATTNQFGNVEFHGVFASCSQEYKKGDTVQIFSFRSTNIANGEPMRFYKKAK